MGEATIRDVARRADVSVASVSRALNGLSSVRAETRDRILRAAQDLGYVPHAGARSLSMARTQAIGVVLPDLHGEFFSEIVRGLDRAAQERGYHLLLSSMHANPALAADALRSMRGRVDGLIVMAPQTDPRIVARMLPASLPAVLINSPDGAGRPVLRVDNRAAAAAMAGHLIERGRRALVHIAGPCGNIDAAERREGFAATVTSAGLSATVLAGDFSEESGEAAVAALLASGTPFDAIFAANDMMAIGALQALRAAGIMVPDAVAVAGFDDVPLARFLSLTTMQVRMADIGESAAARLIAAIDGGMILQGDEAFVPILVPRATTVSTEEASA